MWSRLCPGVGIPNPELYQVWADAPGNPVPLSSQSVGPERLATQAGVLRPVFRWLLSGTWADLDKLFSTKTFPTFDTPKNAVEASLFVGDQCSWISRVTLIHEFTSLGTCNKNINLYETWNELASSPRTLSKFFVINYQWPSDFKWFHSKWNGAEDAQEIVR